MIQPPISDPLHVMLAHDRWATTQLLDASATLSETDFHRRFEIGLGSMHDTLTHIIGVVRGWTATLAGKDGVPRLEATTLRTVPQLAELHTSISDDFSREALSKPFDEVATAVRGGKSYTFPRGVIVTHVLTHGMHHRAQALNILRQLGVTKQPLSAITQWSWYADRGNPRD